MAGIVLKFSPTVGSEVTKGPFPRIRVEGEVMRADPGGPVIAYHDDHHWQVDGRSYSRLDCDCPAVQVYFERIDGTRSKIYGPLKDFSFVDGIAYMEHQVFAFADRSIIDWYCHADGQHWPLMVIEPA